MNDLGKIYLLKKNLAGGATYGVTNPMVEAFLGKMFVHIGENYDGGKLDSSMPVFKFGAKQLTLDLGREGWLQDSNLYSPVSLCTQATSKQGIYELLDGDYMPESYFDADDACLLDFPIVVKPIFGWGGKGVRVISEPDDLPDEDGLIYQQHLNIKREYRFTMVRDKLIFVAKRLPNSEKTQAIYDGVDLGEDQEAERNKFRWRKRNIQLLTNRGYRWFRKAVEIAKDVMARTKLGVAGLDIAVTEEGETYLLECNTSLGMTHDQSVLLYEAIFEDWYGRPVDHETKKTLDMFGAILQEARKLYVKSNYPSD